MSQDFKKDYDLYRSQKAPELWGRIEMGLEEKTPKKKSTLARTARFAMPIAACLLLGFAGLQVYRLQGDRVANAPQGETLKKEAYEDSVLSGNASDAQEKALPQEETIQNEIAQEEAIQNEAPQEEALRGETPQEEAAPQERIENEPATNSVQVQVKGEKAMVSEIQGEAAMEESPDHTVMADSLDGLLDSATYEEEPEELYIMEEAPETFMAEYSFSNSPLYGAPPMMAGKNAYGAGYYTSESYAPSQENEFQLTQVQPLSTFAADVDTASYSNVRRMIENGYGMENIYPGAVRLEEFVNYFSYQIPDPKEGEVFGSTFEVTQCPWNENHQLLFVGLKTEDIDLSEAPRENLTFLLDVSGSMEDSNKLPLVKRAFLSLLEELGEEDTISLVTYADGVEVLLDSVKGDQKEEIRKTIENLEASGGTYGEGGIQRAYELAEKNYQEGSNNRILLATDGDLNIGISEPEELKKFIKEKKDQGIFLSVLGFGTGNIRDDNMEALADSGNGTYHYIDSILEAKKVLVEEMGSSLHIVAKDVKLQVEFNPAIVNAYRQLGYENRQLDAIDFRNDQKDGGEVGAGGEVIVLYELIPVSSPEAITLTYTDNKAGDSTDYATLRLRYKLPQEESATEVALPIPETAYQAKASDDVRFACAVAELALVLKEDSQLGEKASLEHVMELLEDMDLQDEYRQEFSFLVRLLVKRAS